jgi:N-sulfoglucosamine sulfohydrolase
MIIRGPQGEEYGAATAFNGGKVIDALTQHLDIFPTLCDLIGAKHPAWLSGKSLVPLITGESDTVHEVIFTEQTYHASRQPRPFRAVRSQRYKYIRSYQPDQPRGVDRGPAQAFWEAYDYQDTPYPEEMLFDLIFDPHEANNLANSPAHMDILAKMRTQLRSWMEETRDPLLDGKIPEPPTF